MADNQPTSDNKAWFVLRDLKRWNAARRGIDALRDAGFEVFTPVAERMLTLRGRKERRLLPVIPDLLFAHAAKRELDPVLAQTPLLQYRFVRGRSINEPLTVDERDMARFIHAVTLTENPLYYMPEEITPAMVGKRVRIIGGALDGYEGNLLSVRGMRKKRLLVELPGCLVAAAEVEPDYLQVIPEE